MLQLGGSGVGILRVVPRRSISAKLRGINVLLVLGWYVSKQQRVIELQPLPCRLLQRQRPGVMHQHTSNCLSQSYHSSHNNGTLADGIATHSVFSWDVPRILGAGIVRRVRCWHVQRQRASVVHCVSAWQLPKQNRAIELHSLPCRHLQRQRPGIMHQHTATGSFTPCPQPARWRYAATFLGSML